MSDVAFSWLINRIFGSYLFILFCLRTNEIQKHILAEDRIVQVGAFWLGKSDL